MRPRPDRVTASFFDPLPKPIPEHFSILISRDTARNKACQTYSAYNTYWPEAYMDPTDYFLISKTNKHLRTNTLSELTTIPENEKETQTSITYNKLSTTVGPNQCSILTREKKVNIYVPPYSWTLKLKQKKLWASRLRQEGVVWESPWRRRPRGWPCSWAPSEKANKLWESLAIACSWPLETWNLLQRILLIN